MKRLVVILIPIIAGFLFSLEVYANPVFKEISNEILDKMPQIEMQKLIKKYHNVRISDKAYFVSFTKTVTGEMLANLTTEIDSRSPYSIGIVVSVRKAFVKHALKLKKGQRVRFSGQFVGVKMTTLLLDKGVVSR